MKQLRKDFAGLERGWAEDGHQALQAQALQQRLLLGRVEEQKRTMGRRVAVLEGFSLHAATYVHANDREGLRRLCRYGSRGPVAEERLSRKEDGTYEYRTKRGQHLVLGAAELVRRLVALIPPKRTHLINFHGVFAPHAKLRPRVTQLLPVELPEPGPSSAIRPAGKKDGHPKRSRLDWATLQARTFGIDVFSCRCGGKRRVLAIITSRRTAEEVLGNMGLLERGPALAVPRSQGPPQLSLAM